MRLRAAPLSSYTSKRGLAGDFVRSVLAHRDGSLWVGSSKGVSRFTPTGLQRVGLGTPLEQESVLSLAEARNGDVWIGTFASGALRWRDGTIIERIDREAGLPANAVRSLIEAADGSLWIATARGVMRWRPGRPPLILTEAEGLPGNFSMSLLADQHGAVWIGTGLGVAIHDGVGLRRLPLDSVNVADAFAFHEDANRGQVWIATDRGLVRCRGADGSLRTAFAPGLRLAVSIGVASDAGHGSHERLLARADAALYRAKQQGRNRVCGEAESTGDA